MCSNIPIFVVMTTGADNISFRLLTFDELERIREIDRSETISESYRLEQGSLQLFPSPELVSGFDAAELEAIIDRQQTILEHGGVAIGAFDGPMLAGVASVNRKRFGADAQYCKMDILYTSNAYRNHRLGARLLALCREKGKAYGAKALYISATPTRNTVDFYLRHGARILSVPDPELFRMEPEDIHMELIL